MEENPVRVVKDKICSLCKWCGWRETTANIFTNNEKDSKRDREGEEKRESEREKESERE
jgi:hypothetical protein